MPTYNYKCAGCGNKFQQRRRCSEREEEAECPECGAENSERLMNTFAVGSSGSSKKPEGCADGSCPFA